MVKAFEKEYDVDISVSTFNDTDEALTKIAPGAVTFDIYFPSYDQIGKMVTAELLRPLNQELHHQHRQPVAAVHRPLVRRRLALLRPLHASTPPASAGAPTWSTTTSPRSTTPTTSFWDPAYRDNLARHRRLAHGDGHGAARNGITDVNTGKADDLDILRSS